MKNILIAYSHFSAPIGSISSMEVNVDLLDQMELIDLSDQDPVDVFFGSVGEEGVLSSPLPGMKTGSNVKKGQRKSEMLITFCFLFPNTKQATTATTWPSGTGCFGTSSRAWTASPACPPHRQIVPLTARLPTSTEETLLWSGRTTRRRKAAQS